MLQKIGTACLMAPCVPAKPWPEDWKSTIIWMLNKLQIITSDPEAPPLQTASPQLEASSKPLAFDWNLCLNKWIYWGEIDHLLTQSAHGEAQLRRLHSDSILLARAPKPVVTRSTSGRKIAKYLTVTDVFVKNKNRNTSKEVLAGNQCITLTLHTEELV